jgi:hypothetical protein
MRKKAINEGVDMNWTDHLRLAKERELKLPLGTMLLLAGHME